MVFHMECLYFLFDLIHYVPSTIFQLNRDRSSWVEPVLSWNKYVLLKDHNAVTRVRLEPAASRSRVKHSTTEQLNCAPIGLSIVHIKCQALFSPDNEESCHNLRYWPAGTLLVNPKMANHNKCCLFSHLLKCFRGLLGKKCVPKSDCSCQIRVHTVALYT